MNVSVLHFVFEPAHLTGQQRCNIAINGWDRFAAGGGSARTQGGPGRVDPSQRHGDNNVSVKFLKARGAIEATALFSG
jgi:hypothetical protein